MTDNTVSLELAILVWGIIFYLVFAFIRLGYFLFKWDIKGGRYRVTMREFSDGSVDYTVDERNLWMGITEWTDNFEKKTYEFYIDAVLRADELNTPAKKIKKTTANPKITPLS